MTLASAITNQPKKALKTQLKTVYKTMTFALIWTLALICAAPSAATAQGSPQSLSKMVAYSDLNLDSSEAGAVVRASICICHNQTLAT